MKRYSGTKLTLWIFFQIKSYANIIISILNSLSLWLNIKRGRFQRQQLDIVLIKTIKWRRSCWESCEEGSIARIHRNTCFFFLFTTSTSISSSAFTRTDIPDHSTAGDRFTAGLSLGVITSLGIHGICRCLFPGPRFRAFSQLFAPIDRLAPCPVNRRHRAPCPLSMSRAHGTAESTGRACVSWKKHRRPL